MIGRLGLRISAVFRATAPDPFVLAVLLTLLTFALAFTLTDSTPASLVDHWGGPSGVWSLLAFGMQMCLILVTGHALASSPPVSAVLNRLASLPRTGAQAAALVAFVACTLSVCNWGLGLIAGGLLAKRGGEAMERRGRPAHSGATRPGVGADGRGLCEAENVGAERSREDRGRDRGAAAVDGVAAIAGAAFGRAGLVWCFFAHGEGLARGEPDLRRARPHGSQHG